MPIYTVNILITDEYYYDAISYEKLLAIFDCINKAKDFAKQKLIQYKKNYPLNVVNLDTENFIHPKYHIRIYEENINSPINLDRKPIEFDTSVWDRTRSNFWDRANSI